MNNVCLIGRIVKDIELNTTQSGNNNCKFTLAVNRKFKDANGEKQADFISCVAWRNQAEFLNNYCSKGNQVAVEGRIQTGSYDKDDGTKVYTTDIIVSSVVSLEKRDDNNTQQPAAHTPQQHQSPVTTTPPVDDDDLPF